MIQGVDKAMVGNFVNTGTPAILLNGMLTLLALALPCAAYAGDFSVTPIRVDFSLSTRSAAVTVINDSATEAQSYTVKLFLWTQNAEGNDVYEDSSDLVYFPRQMTIPSKSEQVIRVGLKGVLPTREKAYRLFIEEQAVAGDAAPQVTNTPRVNYRLRFGVPIFLVPAAPQTSGKLEVASIKKAALSVIISNSGNQHFRLEQISLRSKGVMIHEVTGPYVLAGARRTFTFDLPEGLCERLKSTEDVELVGASGKFMLTEKVQPQVVCK